MMTKKSLFFVLALTLTAVLLLTACGKTPTDSSDKNTAPATASAPVSDRSSDREEPSQTTPAVSDLPATDNTTPAPSTTTNGPSGPEQKLLTREEAKAAVLAHAGLTNATVRRIETDLDRERGFTVYEVDFDHDGYEYEYVLNAETGEILFHEKERDWDD